MRKILLSVLGVLLIIGAVFGARAIIANKQRPKPKVDKQVNAVFVDTVQNTTIPIEIKATGSLVAKKRVELYSEVQGVFKSGSKPFKVGQLYNRGSLLINIDANEYYATVQAAKSELYNLVTSIMPDLRLDYPEYFPKWQRYLADFDMSKAVPQLPEAQTEQERYFITGRGLYSSYYSVKNLEQRLSKYRLYAPFTGVLTNTLVTEGTLIRPGQKLGDFIATGSYEMEVAIGKEYADMVQVGAEVILKKLNDPKEYDGKVLRVNGSIDQATQTVTSFIEVQNPNLKEGMYMEALLEGRKIEKAVSLDRNLLQSNNKVFVVKSDVLDMVEVSPVHFTDKKVVLQGLKDGTLLVNKSVPGAYPGMLVQVYRDKGINNDTTSTPGTTANAVAQ